MRVRTWTRTSSSGNWPSSGRVRRVHGCHGVQTGCPDHVRSVDASAVRRTDLAHQRPLRDHGNQAEGHVTGRPRGPQIHVGRVYSEAGENGGRKTKAQIS